LAEEKERELMSLSVGIAIGIDGEEISKNNCGRNTFRKIKVFFWSN
jgi:hypothetical protein